MASSSTDQTPSVDGAAQALALVGNYHESERVTAATISPKGRNLLGKDKVAPELPGPPSPGAPSENIPVKEEDIEEIKMDGE